MILELLQKNYDIKIDSITFNRKGGCVSYILKSGNEKCSKLYKESDDNGVIYEKTIRCS